VEETDILVNCPVVPEGSTATEGPGANGLVQGWYDDQAVFYFDFNEAPLAVTPSDAVPTSPIFVTFEIDPDEPGGGPLSAFRTQGSSDLTHNVLATLPGDAGYSPLWDVIPYDNTSFDGVWNLDTAADAPDFGVAGQVNCPVVFVGEAPGDPSTATRTVVDRFSDNAGMLFRRSVDPSLPAAGTAVDFDAEPFITTGFGPDGEVASYYNFDVMSADPAPIHAFFFESGDPVPNQLNVVGVVPGDVGYNDFWRLVRVTVPDDYIANSVQDISTAGLDTEVTDILVNCPIVPGGSTADLRLGGEDPGLVQGWAAGEIVHYFNFGEAPLSVTAQDEVPTSAIYVTFNVNPDQPGGGPPSGFMVEGGTWQTHNVLEKLPGDVGYSPLWAVFPYDNASFGTVVDLATAQAATSFGFAALVNCPVVELP
jgi:hypothetical protein